MAPSYIERFNTHLLTEADDIFEKICERKYEIERQAGDIFSEEANLSYFIQQYEYTFYDHEKKRAELVHAIEELEKLLQSQQEKDPILEQVIRTPPEVPADEMEPMPAIEEDPAQEAPIARSSVASLFERSEPKDTSPQPEETAEPPPPQVQEAVEKEDLGDDEVQPDAIDVYVAEWTQIEKPKRFVANAFRWIFHPRDWTMHTSFYEARARLLSRLINDDKYDEVDILMRLPFTEEDRRLWYLPIRRQRPEGPGERLYRFRLWEWLLREGEKRAAKFASQPKHDLYPLYREWKATGDESPVYYFQKIAQDRKTELEDLKQRLEQLQSELRAIRQ